MTALLDMDARARRQISKHGKITVETAANRNAPIATGQCHSRGSDGQGVADLAACCVARSARLDRRYERRADIHQALISLACSVICLRQLILN